MDGFLAVGLAVAATDVVVLCYYDAQNVEQCDDYRLLIHGDDPPGSGRPLLVDFWAEWKFRGDGIRFGVCAHVEKERCREAVTVLWLLANKQPPRERAKFLGEQWRGRRKGP